MVDYAVDDSFDIFKNEYNDIAEVDGYEEFEDDLLVAIHYSLQEHIGDRRSRKTLQEKVTLLITRTAKRFGIEDTISRIDVSEVSGSTDTLSVNIVYSTDRSFQETI